MTRSFPTALAVAASAVLALGLIGFAPPAKADWNPGDPYKMHVPQLPDPYGWDVQFSGKTLADDWQCTQTGPVSDIHIWNSYFSDLHGTITNVHISIHSDVPGGTGTASHPGTLLWQRDFIPGQFTERLYDPGQTGNPTQGYLVPGGAWVPLNHAETWQINIANIQAPFIQEVGTIYWLDVSVAGSFPDLYFQTGWKTSTDHFMDNAVWWDGVNGQWQELIDPVTSQSLDLAFVITPEPSSFALIGLGTAGLLLLRRRR